MGSHVGDGRRVSFFCVSDGHIDVIITTRHSGELASERARDDVIADQAGRQAGVKRCHRYRGNGPAAATASPSACLMLYLQSDRGRGTNAAVTSSNRQRLRFVLAMFGAI